MNFYPHQFVAFANVLDSIADASGLLTRAEKEILKQEVALFIFDCVERMELNGLPPASAAYHLARRLADIIADIAAGDCAEYEEHNHNVGLVFELPGFEVLPSDEAKRQTQARDEMCLYIERGRYSLQRA